MKPMSIREFAAYILAQKDVKQALEEYYAARAVADRLIDACAGLKDTGGFILYSTEEEKAYTQVITDMDRSVRKVAVDRLSESVCKEYRGIDRLSLDYTAMHTFRCFCLLGEMEHYLLYHVLPFIRGDTNKVGIQEVLCLYIWLYDTYSECPLVMNFKARRHLLGSHKDKLSHEENGEMRLQFDNAIVWGSVLLDGEEHVVNDDLLTTLADA